MRLYPIAFDRFGDGAVMSKNCEPCMARKRRRLGPYLHDVPQDPGDVFGRGKTSPMACCSEHSAAYARVEYGRILDTLQVFVRVAPEKMEMAECVN